MLVIVLAGLLLLFALSKWENKKPTEDTASSAVSTPAYEEERELIYVGEDCYAFKENLETVLILGVDKYIEDVTGSSYNNNQQSDFLVLLVFDHNNESYTAVHINRDTMTEITKLGINGEEAGSFTGQIALAHTYGRGGSDSCRNAARAVSGLFYGIEVNHYIATTMDSVGILNDKVGGVTLTVLDDFSEKFPEMSKGAELKLDGEQAMAYVRTRYGLEEPTNLRRMERQRQYLNALKPCVVAAAEESDTFIFDMLGIVSEYLVSDCTIQQLSDVCNNALYYTDNGIRTIEGEAVKGKEFIEFYADDSSIQQVVLDLFYEPYTEEK